MGIVKRVTISVWLLGLVSTAPQTLLACDAADIVIKQSEYHLSGDFVRVVGEIVNNCKTSVGVNLQVAFRDARGKVTGTESFWPASVNNINAGASFPFSTTFHADYQISTMDTNIIGINTWGAIQQSAPAQIDGYIKMFTISSGSMLPALKNGERLFGKPIARNTSSYGDIIVFKKPPENRIDYIKRVVGIPGDTIQILGGKLLINGSSIPRSRIEDFVSRDKNGNVVRSLQYLQTLPNGVTYSVLKDYDDQGPADNTMVYKVPSEHYFVIGDNMDHSQDSRYLDEMGYIPAENIGYVAKCPSGQFVSHLNRLLPGEKCPLRSRNQA